MADRLQSQVENLILLVEKCKPLGKTVLIEILKLRNARMKVIIVVPASAGRQLLSRSPWLVVLQLPCLDSRQMKTINPCRSPIIMCYFLNTQRRALPPATGTDFISISTQYLGSAGTLKPVLKLLFIPLPLVMVRATCKHKNLPNI